MLSIACISQKGGVGKSTLSRLIARTYAAGGWRVKIADFNVKQRTSVDWAATRMAAKIEPYIDAAPYTNLDRALHDGQGYDLIVFDGKPDSDASTLDLAKEANLCLIPTGETSDDLMPQVRFAHELRSRGVAIQKMLFVLNRTTGSQTWNDNTREALNQSGFPTADTGIPFRTGYVNAQNQGRALSETNYATLNDQAEALAQEVVTKLSQLAGL